jgi:hypothetical protein
MSNPMIPKIRGVGEGYPISSVEPSWTTPAPQRAGNYFAEKLTADS